MTEKIQVYEPDNSLKNGYLPIFKEIIEEFRDSRWLIYQLFKREFLTIYKQSLMGVLWTFIIPFVSVATFIVMDRSGIFIIGEIDVPYPLFAVMGLSLWQLFSSGLVACSNSLVRSGSMIIKINFSKKSLVIASMGMSAVSFVIQFMLAVLLFLYYGEAPRASLLYAPILIIPLLLLTLGIGLILSLLNAVIRDIGNVISILMTFLMFLTPIMYAKPTSGVLAQMTRLNPLYYLITVPRDFLLSGSIHDMMGFLAASSLSVMIFVASLVAFHLTETRIAERI